MKKLSNYVVAVLCVSSLAFSAGAFMKVNATPAATAAPAGQPVANGAVLQWSGTG